MEKIKEFYLELIKDDEFKARLAQFRQENGDDYEKIIEKLVLPQAKKMGYDFTKEDLLAYENENGENGLSDEELLNVAGGGMAQFAAIALTTIMSLSSAAALLGGNQSASKQAMSSASPETSYTQMFEAKTQDGKEQENQDFNTVNAGGEELEIQNSVTEEAQKGNEINNLSEKTIISEAKEEKESSKGGETVEEKAETQEDTDEEANQEVAATEVAVEEDDDEAPPPVARTKEQKEAHYKAYLEKLAKEEAQKAETQEDTDEEKEDTELHALFDDLEEEDDEDNPEVAATDVEVEEDDDEGDPPPLPDRDAPDASEKEDDETPPPLPDRNAPVVTAEEKAEDEEEDDVDEGAVIEEEEVDDKAIPKAPDYPAPEAPTDEEEDDDDDEEGVVIEAEEDDGDLETPDFPAPNPEEASSAPEKEQPSSLLDEIKQGKKLKSAKDRVIPEAPQSLEDSIRKRVTARRHSVEVEYDDEEDDVYDYDEDFGPEKTTSTSHQDTQPTQVIQSGNAITAGLMGLAQSATPELDEQGLDLALNKEKEQGKKEIDGMLEDDNISEEQAKKAKDKIDRAKTPEEINSILADLFE